MKLTKFGHSCVRLDDRGSALTLDPGVFSDSATALEGADAVLITHEHPDHIDTPALLAAAQANPSLRVWAPAVVAATLTGLGERVTIAEPGTAFDAAGFPVRTFGGQHALIHSLIPVVANVAYLIAEDVYHPGDSFTVPAATVRILLIPIHAPWSKLAEVVDFTIAVRAEAAHQIHDGLLNDIGRGMVEGHVTRLGEVYGTAFSHLDTGAEIELG